MADVKYFEDLNPLAPAATTDDAKILALQTDPKNVAGGYKVTLLEFKDYVNSGKIGGKTIEGGTLTAQTLRMDNNAVDQIGFTINGLGDVEFDQKISLDAIDFYLSSITAIQEGRLIWDAVSGTLNLGMTGGVVTLPIGQAVYLPDRPKNKQGVQINKGQVVFISGYAVGVIQVQLANAADFADSFKTIAVANEDIVNNQQGYYATLGLVDGIKTNYAGWTEGDTIYLDSVDGGLTKVKPVAPNSVIKIGYVLEVHATTGKIFVKIEEQGLDTVKDITKEPTGFTAPEDIIVTGDGVARTVTLTGTVNGYYRGIPVPTLITGYVSPAHANDVDPYFLVFDGSTISWVTPANFDFAYLLIAYTFYDASNAQRVYMRECHSMQPWPTHRNEHDTIGTYRKSGGTLSDYILASTTAADRRPSVSEATIFDEDLPTANPVLAAGGNYTNFFLSGADVPNFAPTAVEVVPVSGTQPYWNEFTGGAWQQTLMTNNYYQSVWLVAIPAAADSDSQDYRFAWVQGQSESLTITAQQGLSPQDVSLGTFNAATPELIFISQVITKYLGGNWTFEEVRNLTGTRASQTSSPQGDFLSVVTSDPTLLGSGTVSDPLSVTPTLVTVGAVGSAANYNSIEDARAAGNKAVNVLGVFPETKDINLGGINLDIYVQDTLNMGAFKVNSTGGNLVLHGEKITTAYTIASTKFWTTTNGDITYKCNEFNTELNFGSDLGLTNITGTGRVFISSACKFRLSNNAGAGFNLLNPGSIVSNCLIEGGGAACEGIFGDVDSAIISDITLTDTFATNGSFLDQINTPCVFSNITHNATGLLKMNLTTDGNQISNVHGNFDVDLDDTSLNKIVNCKLKGLRLSDTDCDFNLISNVEIDSIAVQVGGDRNKITNFYCTSNFTVEGSSNKITQIFCNGIFTYGASAQLNHTILGEFSGGYADNGTNNTFTNQISDSILLTLDSPRIMLTEHAVKGYYDASDPGEIHGFTVKYSDTDTVTITAGFVRANGKRLFLSSDTTHDLTTLASGFDHHYIYIDDSATTAPTAVIIDSTTEPVWSDSKMGFYNGDDRMIGSVVSTDGAATIIYFDAMEAAAKSIRVTMPRSTIVMATNMAASGGAWQTPSLLDGSVATPVSATGIRIHGISTDTADANFYASTVEMVAVMPSRASNSGIRFSGYLKAIDMDDMVLGASRNIKIATDTNDDDALTAHCMGFCYKR